MSVIGCQGSQDPCISVSMPGGLTEIHVLGTPMTVWVFISSFFFFFFESVDRCYMHSTLRTVSVFFLLCVW